MKRLIIPILTVVIVAALGFATFGQSLGLLEFLANLHVWNQTEYECNDLEICITGICACCILESYIYWMGDELVPIQIIPTSTGVCLRWYNPNQLVPPGGEVHGGIKLDPDCPIPRSVQVTWTIDGHPITEVPTPWQSWVLGEEGEIIDILQYTPGPEGKEPLIVNREVAIVYRPILLKHMMPNIIDEYVKRYGGQWESIRTEILYPNVDLPLVIQVPPDAAAVVVRFTAARESEPEKILSYSFHQAVFERRK